MGGPLTFEELQDASQNEIHKNIKYFVETGTYKADTTLMVSAHYDKVFTTEIHEGLYNESKQRAKDAGVTNIKFLYGDSIKLLPTIMEDVKEGAVFFLDAHISGNDSGWNEENRVPIFEELDVILSYNVGPSIFIIDDLRLWKGAVWDWAHITNIGIIQRFVDAGYKISSFYEKNDRFYVLTE